MIKYIMFNAIFGGVVWLAYIGYQPAITVFKILAVVSGLIMLLYWSVLKLLKRQRGTGDLKAAEIYDDACKRILKSKNVQVWWLRYVDAAYDLTVMWVMWPIAPVAVGFYFFTFVGSQQLWTDYYYIRKTRPDLREV